MEKREYDALVEADVAPKIIAQLAKAQAEAQLALFEKTGKPLYEGFSHETLWTAEISVEDLTSLIAANIEVDKAYRNDPIELELAAEEARLREYYKQKDLEDLRSGRLFLLMMTRPGLTLTTLPTKERVMTKC